MSRTLTFVAATPGAKPLISEIIKRVNPKQFETVEIIPVDMSAITYAVFPSVDIHPIGYAKRYAQALAKEGHRSVLPLCPKDTTIISLSTKAQRFNALNSRAEEEGCDMFRPNSYEEVFAFWKKYLNDGFFLEVGIHTSKRVLVRDERAETCECDSLCLRDDMHDDFFFRMFLMSQMLLHGFNESGPDAPFNEGYFKHILYPPPIPDVDVKILSMRIVTWILSELLSPGAFRQYTKEEVGEELWHLAALEHHWTWRKLHARTAG